ncbi:hypothetical protein ACFTXJ_14380 [Streptomyces zhihengii]|uniref:hypothetical protein n=1 Tax=Streptomyces zhihengii TaxID=1818004 RepID=UPI003633245E
MNFGYEDDMFAATSDEIAIAAAGDLSDPANPVTTVFAFAAAVLHDDGPDLDSLRLLCTAESWEAWDFNEARRLLDGYGASTHTAAPTSGESDVRYGKYVAPIGTGDETLLVKQAGPITGLILTMVFQRRTGRWMAHSLGDYLLPEQLPRDS